MSAREMILKRIAEARPALIPLVVTVSPVENTNPDLIDKFSEVLQGIGGEVSVMSNISFVDEYLYHIKAQGNRVVNCVKGLDLPIEILVNTKVAGDYENVFVACMKGTLAVAENASVWVDEADMLNRLLPFICQHLILVIDAENFVANMHQAYQKIDTIKSGYGTFIAGPSKTADIEQSLVIGAHGPRSLKVFIIQQEVLLREKIQQKAYLDSQL